MKRIWIPQVIVAVLLLWGVYPHNPYGYYIFLRWACFAGLVYLTVRAAAAKKEGWACMLGLAALAYNPFARIHLPREAWSGINVVTAAVVLTSILFLRPIR